MRETMDVGPNRGPGSETEMQTRKPLPASLMKMLAAMCRDDEISPADRLEAALLVSHGYGLWQQAESIDPRAFAIPEDQWREIAEGLSAPVRESITAVDVVMEWMNKGPSAYDPAEVEEAAS